MAGASLCALLGLGLLIWSSVRLWGYDFLFGLKLSGAHPPRDVVIVYMTDDSFASLGQTSVPNWDRSYHARLVNKLTLERAKVVVFDVVFDTTNSPATDAELAQAIRRNGRVVLAAGRVEGIRHHVHTASVIRPIDAFLEAGATWGIAAVYQPQQDGPVARESFVGSEMAPSLPWAAAKVVGAPITQVPNARQPAVFLNYYGPALTLPWISYADALNKESGYFRDKCVFVGLQPKLQNPLDETVDSFRTPYTVMGGYRSPGVEIGATAFLNLLRQDGLTELNLASQIALVALIGLGFGAGLSRLKMILSAAVAVVGVLAVLAITELLAGQYIWWGWTIPVFVQIPLALAWSVGGQYIRLRFEKDVLTRTLEETTRLVEATKLTAQKPAQLVPDHELVRLVGKGAYGDVWLARNAVGVYHAVKIVRRAAFPSDVPYEREFRGIQKFMPVSRTHAGFVHVLHVGRNDTDRCFYCIMEAGDDQTTGQKIDPETYLPKSLATELKWRGRLAPEETLRLGLSLTLALEHLHQSRLIHRDIKPGNIIYVNGQPKFADIGLVTDIAGEGKDVSFLGTQGYIPPEGPGSPGADVYALGKVLYEAAMGRDREFFPEVPTAVYEEADDSLLRRLQAVIFKACEDDVNVRFQTAAELHAALLKLEGGKATT